MQGSFETQCVQPQRSSGCSSFRGSAWRSASIWAVTIAGTAALAGCGAPQPPAAAVPVKFEDLPPAFVETAQKELPGVRFDSAFRKSNGTLEIRGREKNGKVREVEIRPDGSVEEIE